MSFTQIVPLDRYNWEQCLAITLTPEQEGHIPPVLYSLAQAKFEDLKSFGIVRQERMVGLLMYGEFGGICWISRVMIDQGSQRQGIGRAAVSQLLQQLRRNISCREIRSSYATDNYPAAQFFATLGFVPLDAQLNDEVVVRYEPAAR
jgi:diamine N-acetyltransferase